MPEPETVQEVPLEKQQHSVAAATWKTMPHGEPSYHTDSPAVPDQQTEMSCTSALPVECEELERVATQLEELMIIRQSVAAATSNSPNSISNRTCLNATLNALHSLDAQLNNGQEEVCDCLQLITEMLLTMHTISNVGRVSNLEPSTLVGPSQASPEKLPRESS
ncbi:hypothetical protein NDU88_005909 [Pleurodeles waltl]|uniref:Uncharacterized protein n=1 Tax=Pleurodeles waltl TaxID=8319 RepID=A0AAV7QII8_PLEWA|nr:hypothetical protein NDU88_005909 [Pleurodeles waltl]